MSNYFDDRAQLAGKVAVVIGGGEGMGRAITKALLENSVDVYMGDYNDEAMSVTVRECEGLPGRLICSHVDVCGRDELKSFWDRFDEHFDRINILVNVAGGSRHQEFLEQTPEQWDTTLRKNLLYVIESTYEAGRRMKAGGKGGSIVNLTTIEAYRAAPGHSVYVSAKAGLVGWTRAMSTEFAPYGIRLNCVAPDQTPTPGMLKCINLRTYDPRPSGISREKYMEALDAQNKIAIPLGRLGELEDITKAVLFYASDLSSYITGGTLHVDGGAMASAGWFYFPEQGYRNRVPCEMIANSQSFGKWPSKSTGDM